MKAYITLQAEIIHVGGNRYIFGGRDEVEAEAIFRNSVVIPALTAAKEIKIASINLDKFHFLMIKASRYDDDTGKLTYSVGAAPETFKLTTAHSFRGVGQAQFLPAPPESFIFKNMFTEDITIEILALWDHGSGGAPPTPTSFRIFRDQMAVSSPGQTVFSLAFSPSYAGDTILIVEGVIQEYGVGKDFTVVGNALTWLDRHFTFEIGDWVEARYLT